MSHLFLTGPSGIGKSTLLLSLFSDYGLSASGLFTQRLIFEDGSLAGFRLLPWSAELPVAALYKPDMPDVFIERTAQGWKKDLTVFAGTGVMLLDAASKCNIICLDEIGGTELLEPEFNSRLYHTLAAHSCCIGVIKGMTNLAAMTDTLGLPYQEAQMLSRFHHDLTERFHSRILSVTSTNKNKAADIIRGFITRGDGNDI